MVQLIETEDELKSIKRLNLSCGLVPTMGNLHKGHLSLIEKSISENDITIISIFVNPKQFGPGEDFDKYPRTLELDLKLIESVVNNNDHIYVFAPSHHDKIFHQQHRTVISVPDFEQILCGKSRPGHFKGVCAIVYQLFKIIKPNRAYFGEKDYQQLQIIRSMTRDLLPEIQIIGMPIIRDNHGLALSSRNNFLCSTERKKALVLHNSLNIIKDNFSSSNTEQLPTTINQLIRESELKYPIKWEYLQVLDAENLKPVSALTRSVLVAGALKINDVRLIDNLTFQRSLSV